MPSEKFKKRRPKYLNPGKRHGNRVITLSEEALYKPFLIMFVIFLFAMVVLFPNSIFDDMIPGVMMFLRRLIGWLWFSAVATLLPLPVSVFDVQLLAIFSDTVNNSDLFVVFVIAFAVFADTLFAFVGYRFTKTLSRLFLRKVKAKDAKKSSDKLNKYGNYAMFLFASTPLPFTLAVYTAGAIRLNRKGFLLAVAMGRLVKYAAFALFLRLLDINLAELGQNLISTVFG